MAAAEEPAPGLAGLVPRLLPLLQWPELGRLCVTGRGCGRGVVRAIHERYLGSGPASLAARLEGLGRRLAGTQAAQAQGSPEALARASTELVVLEQCTRVLAQNCEFYADVFERVGFTVGEELDTLATALLESLERVQAFQQAVSRLKEAASARPWGGISCRRTRVEDFGSDGD
mmetsp:Transcript_37667/g.116140  ORF Transcript_37667/g.116140 Transcript_37667/m.116140 type:complete len:174 (+) Transcript_37667:2-523(+)